MEEVQASQKICWQFSKRERKIVKNGRLPQWQIWEEN